MKIVLTFFVFVIAQGLLAGSINTIFDLIPIRIDRLFARDNSDDSCSGFCSAGGGGGSRKGGSTDTKFDRRALVGGIGSAASTSADFGILMPQP